MCISMWVCRMRADAPRGQQRDWLLQSSVTIGYEQPDVGAGNRIRVPCKSSRRSELLSPSCSPFIFRVRKLKTDSLNFKLYRRFLGFEPREARQIVHHWAISSYLLFRDRFVIKLVQTVSELFVNPCRPWEPYPPALASNIHESHNFHMWNVTVYFISLVLDSTRIRERVRWRTRRRELLGSGGHSPEACQWPSTLSETLASIPSSAQMRQMRMVAKGGPFKGLRKGKTCYHTGKTRLQSVLGSTLTGKTHSPAGRGWSSCFARH